MVGGFGNQQSPIDAVERYEPKSSEWASLPVSLSMCCLLRCLLR